MRLSPKKTNSMVVSRFRTSDPGYGDSLLDELSLRRQSLRILGVTIDSKLTFEMHLREVVSKAARNLGIVRRVGKLFDCPRVLNGCSNAMSHLHLLDSIVCSAERLCKGELCSLGNRKKVSASCLPYKIYHRVEYPMNEYLKHLVAMALVIPRCRSDQFSRSFLLAAVRL